ncbi:hypothetical protein IC762_01725 [Bradyrhizobium genosp. L]|uniref:hypothetical protein n=1 Tax=Bradyrhizobium genosp. L TaxID=83637 RepID=UPI0018A31A57|nr:hypothetical protein [Bradyrhizobium genosp. L]QPF88437.1 hypothetical protein IC762_01725 [Bradyrhizobium genosp. L]
MTRWIGAVVVAGAFALAAPASAITAVPVGMQAAAQQRHATRQRHAAEATDFSAQRHSRDHHRHHDHDGDRPYSRSYDQPYYSDGRPHYAPYYYGRPSTYRPYPYAVPAPFTFGIGFGPFW